MTGWSVVELGLAPRHSDPKSWGICKRSDGHTRRSTVVGSPPTDPRAAGAPVARSSGRGFTLKLEMEEHFPASRSVSLTQLTMMSSFTFCPPPISSRMFSVYLGKTENDFWRKGAQ